MYFAFANDNSYALPHIVPVFVRDVAKGMASRTFAGDNSYALPHTVPVLVRDVGDGGRESLHRSASQDDGGSLLRMTGAAITR